MKKAYYVTKFVCAETDEEEFFSSTVIPKVDKFWEYKGELYRIIGVIDRSTSWFDFGYDFSIVCSKS